MSASDRQRAWNECGRRLAIGRPPKLTAEQRLEISRRLAAGERTAVLAAEYGVGRSTINRYR